MVDTQGLRVCSRGRRRSVVALVVVVVVEHRRSTKFLRALITNRLLTLHFVTFPAIRGIVRTFVRWVSRRKISTLCVSDGRAKKRRRPHQEGWPLFLSLRSQADLFSRARPSSRPRHCFQDFRRLPVPRVPPPRRDENRPLLRFNASSDLVDACEVRRRGKQIHRHVILHSLFDCLSLKRFLAS